MPALYSFTSCIEQFRDAPVGLNAHYVEVPPEVARHFSSSLPARFVVDVGGVSWHGAVIPRGGGNGCILIGKPILRRLGLKAGDHVPVGLSPETSRYGMPMPEELEEALRQDPEADERFHSLTPGKQRSIIHYVGKIANPQLRIDKALFLLANLKRLPRGKEPVGKIFKGE